jgi:hypothetical protein
MDSSTFLNYFQKIVNRIFSLTEKNIFNSISLIESSKYILISALSSAITLLSYNFLRSYRNSLFKNAKHTKNFKTLENELNFNKSKFLKSSATNNSFYSQCNNSFMQKMIYYNMERNRRIKEIPGSNSYSMNLNKKLQTKSNMLMKNDALIVNGITKALKIIITH